MVHFLKSVNIKRQILFGLKVSTFSETVYFLGFTISFQSRFVSKVLQGHIIYIDLSWFIQQADTKITLA